MNKNNNNKVVHFKHIYQHLKFCLEYLNKSGTISW